jgi:serine/threonine protein kinase
VVLNDSTVLELAAGVREGEILAGKYRVDKVLGAGGMGVVVAARHIQLETRVAIKFLLPAMLDNSEAVMRFAREARAASKINNEHVARVFDVGTLPSGAPFMVMEFLEGEDLSTWIAQRGALPVELAVDFVLQACVAVADAHGLGIVHRDLKPANLFALRRSDGQFVIKVLDFGISKVTDSGATGPVASVTHTSAIMGSPHYMSPEQMRSSKEVDARADIWALGVILFELLAGNTPFSGETFGDILINLATRPPPALRGIRPDFPDGLESVILKCLEKDRANRYGNVAELSVALLPFGSRRARVCVERISGIIQASGLSKSALALPPSPRIEGRPADAERPETAASWAQMSGISNSRRAAVGGIALVGILAIVAGLALLRRPPTAAPSNGAAPFPAADVPLPSGSLATGAPAGFLVTDDAGAPAPLPPLSPVATAPVAATDAGVPRLVIAAPTPRVATPPIAAAPPTAPPAASPAPAPARGTPSLNCKVPFFFDAAGNRVFKKECL